jgi:myo-inositol-1(or 4)-monophosphatase
MNNSNHGPPHAMSVALATAREAGAILRERLGHVRIEYKGPVDLVTEADRASETLVADRLSMAFPNHRLIGEEGIAAANSGSSTAPFAWIVDPLDGTTNFAHGYPHFAVSIALAEDNEVVLGVVYDPMRDELFAAERGRGATLNGRPIQVSTTDSLIRSLLATGFSYDLTERAGQMGVWAALHEQTQGIRRDGAAALNLCYIAAGRLDGFWERPLQPWDMAAGSLIVQEAGGAITAYDGTEFITFGDGIIASNTTLQAILVETVTGTGGESAELIQSHADMG